MPPDQMELRPMTPAGKDMRKKAGIVQLPHAAGLQLPGYHSGEAAGLDLAAACEEPIDLLPGSRVLVPTGLVLELPGGHEGQVRPRSGLAFRHGVTVLNAPGTIDADYRGEVMVLLVNLGSERFRIERGMRIAQLVIAPVCQVELEPRTLAGTTDRGDSGFGSTGI